jgi:hypothetical protein
VAPGAYHHPSHLHILHSFLSSANPDHTNLLNGPISYCGLPTCYPSLCLHCRQADDSDSESCVRQQGQEWCVLVSNKKLHLPLKEHSSSAKAFQVAFLASVENPIVSSATVQHHSYGPQDFGINFCGSSDSRIVRRAEEDTNSHAARPPNSQIQSLLPSVPNCRVT